MSKLKVELIALADYAMTAEDKKLSVIGIFDKIFVKAVPAAHPRMSFIVTLVGEPDLEEKLEIKIISPTKKVVFKGKTTFKYGNNGKANLVNNFEGLPIAEIGTYRFVLEKDGKEVVGQDLAVIQMKEQDGRVAN